MSIAIYPLVEAQALVVFLFLLYLVIIFLFFPNSIIDEKDN